MDIRAQIMEYIKGQVGVDVAEYRTDFTKQWERENEIIIEWREMPRQAQRRIELLANKSNTRIRMENVGVWGKMFAFIG